MSAFISQAFLDRDPSATRQFYDTWAASYDKDIAGLGYCTPNRCAEALRAHLPDPTTPILDFGCGTGLSGQAMRDAGFIHVDGVDLSAEMLEQARAKGIYENLGLIEADATPEGKYTAISAVGVIGLGAAPSTTIDILMRKLPRGGKLVFSFNDFALADAMQTGRLNEWTDCGAASVLLAEYGPHLPAQDIQSTVYVIEKN